MMYPDIKTDGIFEAVRTTKVKHKPEIDIHELTKTPVENEKVTKVFKGMFLKDNNEKNAGNWS